MDGHRDEASLRLRASVREVYTDGGKIFCEMRVYCPEQEHLVSAEECVGCTQCTGVYVNPTKSESFVACTPKTGKGPSVCYPDQVGSITIRNVVCMQPDLSVLAALDILLELAIGAAPVVGKDGKLLGVVSRTDVLQARNVGIDIDDPDRLPKTVEDVMTPFVLAVQENATISQAAALMATEHVHRILVVSPTGELLGILSALDVMRWLAERDGYLPAIAEPKSSACDSTKGDNS